MPYMIGFGDAANPLLTFLPVVLMTLSGYSVGIMISKIRKKIDTSFFTDLVLGNVALNFLFILGFIVFGVLTFAVREYFTTFTYILGALTIVGAYFIIKKIAASVTSISTDTRRKDESGHVSLTQIKSLFQSDNKSTLFFGISLVTALLVFHAIIIYYHPIYSEYDSLYLFLPISKSILLGNGLNHDFYLGSDVNMRYPPYIQAINAWLIHSFEYSSLRMFPSYFVSLAAILVYLITRNILEKTRKKDYLFSGLIASCAFLITPALLVVSSRFSLQQDLGFIFILTASFYFLTAIVRQERPSKINLLMLSVTLSLMALTREIGVVMAISIFFLVPAIKYTQNNLKLRSVFTILSFLPLHFYYFVLYGAVEINSGILLAVSNFGVFYIVSQLKNQNKFSSLIRPVTNITCIAPIVIPAIFIVSNFIMFNGIYPGIVASDRYYEIVAIDEGIFATQGDKQGLSDLIKGIPRIDVLFISVALGTIMIFFKLVGFGRLIRHLKNNDEYSVLLILVILILVTWSFLLQSGFEISNIRHVLYFVPLFSVIFVIGTEMGNKTSNYWKLYTYGILVFISYYFLEYNLVLLNSNNFVGLFIDPSRTPIINSVDLAVAAILVSPLIFHMIRKSYSISLRKEDRRFQNVFVVAIFSAMLIAQIYVLGSTGANLIPLKENERISPPGWEHDVFEVIDYLDGAEQGNVLSVRAPSIPFFTNRTNFDLFNFQTFAYNISDLLSTNTSSLFKSELSNMGIRYIILPSVQSNLYYPVENLTTTYPVLETLSADKDFQNVGLPHFNIYKYIPNATANINLIDDDHKWKPFGQTTVIQNIDNLILAIGTSKGEKIYNRAFLQTEIKLADRPLLLSLEYEVETRIGNATYQIEIRDQNTDGVLFTSLLDNKTGSVSSQTFLLPRDLANKPLEFRIYIITEGPGQHSLSVKKASIAYR